MKSSPDSATAEKDINLTIAKLLRKQLKLQGAIVYLTREDDVYLSLDGRVSRINSIESAIAIYIHYNHAGNSNGSEDVQGIGTYWYHPQAYGLGKFLQRYVVRNLGRPSDGVRWKNLALAGPTIAPSIFLELGVMSNPEELQWIVDYQNQQDLAVVLADGIVDWLSSNR